MTDEQQPLDSAAAAKQLAAWAAERARKRAHRRAVAEQRGAETPAGPEIAEQLPAAAGTATRPADLDQGAASESGDGTPTAGAASGGSSSAVQETSPGQAPQRLSAEPEATTDEIPAVRPRGEATAEGRERSTEGAAVSGAEAPTEALPTQDHPTPAQPKREQASADPSKSDQSAQEPSVPEQSASVASAEPLPTLPQIEVPGENREAEAAHRGSTEQPSAAAPQRTPAPRPGEQPQKPRGASGAATDSTETRTPTAKQAQRQVDRDAHRQARNRRGAGETHRAHGSARRTAERIARRTVDRIVSDPAPTTAPVPVIAVLKGTQFQAPVEAKTKSENEARMVLDLAVDIGVAMLRAGAGSADVEIAVVATCAALGVPSAEVDLTATALTVHYSDPEGRLMTAMRVSRDDSTNYAKLASINRLVADMASGDLALDDARERFDSIRRQRRPYPPWMARLAWGVMIACFINLIGGSIRSSVLGFAMGVLNDWFGARLARTGMPSFFITGAQSTFTTIVAMLAWTLDLVQSPQYVVAGGIVLLLPTQTLLSAVQDALTKFPLTAAARGIQVATSVAGIVSGVALGLMIGRALRLQSFQVIATPGGIAVMTTILALIAAFLVAAAGAVGLQVNRRFVLPAAVIGFIGFIVYVGLTLTGLGNIVTCLLASTIVGFLARLIGERISAPNVALVIPGVFPLLQGMSIFAAVYKMVQEDVSFSDGLSALFTAIIANAALAVGAFFGTFLAGPLRKRQLRRRAHAAQDSADRAVGVQGGSDPLGSLSNSALATSSLATGPIAAAAANSAAGAGVSGVSGSASGSAGSVGAASSARSDSTGGAGGSRAGAAGKPGSATQGGGGENAPTSGMPAAHARTGPVPTHQMSSADVPTHAVPQQPTPEDPPPDP